MINIYLILSIIFLYFISINSSEQHRKALISRVHEINPNLDVSNCISKYNDNSLNLVCKRSHSNETFECPNGPPHARDVSNNNRLALFITSLFISISFLIYRLG
jgi:hypothetical protein